MKKIILSVLFLSAILVISGCGVQESPFQMDEKRTGFGVGSGSGLNCDLLSGMSWNGNNTDSVVYYYAQIDDNSDGIVTGNEFCENECLFNFIEARVEGESMGGQSFGTCHSIHDGFNYMANWSEFQSDVPGINWVTFRVLCCSP